MDISKLNEDEIKSRKDDMSKNFHQLENLSKKMHKLLECANSVIEVKLKILFEATIISKN